MIPSELEMREAARFSSMSWSDFQGLPGTTEVATLLGESNSKCAVIAHFRMARLLDHVLDDLRRKYPER